MNTWTTNLTPPPNKKKQKRPWPHNKNDQPRNWKEFFQLTPPKKEKKTPPSHLLSPSFFGDPSQQPFSSQRRSSSGWRVHPWDSPVQIPTSPARSRRWQVGIAAVRPIPLKPLEKPDPTRNPSFGWGCWNWQQKIAEGWVGCCFFFEPGLFFSGVSLEDWDLCSENWGVVKRNIHVSNICLCVFIWWSLFCCSLVMQIVFFQDNEHLATFTGIYALGNGRSHRKFDIPNWKSLEKGLESFSNMAILVYPPPQSLLARPWKLVVGNFGKGIYFETYQVVFASWKLEPQKPTVLDGYLVIFFLFPFAKIWFI